MPDGLVYVNQSALYGIIKAYVAPDDVKPMLAAAEANEQKRRDILYSVVHELSEKASAIEIGLLSHGYYMIPCILVGPNGKPTYPLLIPFRAEAFGVLPSDLESSKPQAIKDLVKSIRPKKGAQE